MLAYSPLNPRAAVTGLAYIQDCHGECIDVRTQRQHNPYDYLLLGETPERWLVLCFRRHGSLTVHVMMVWLEISTVKACTGMVATA